MQKFGSVTGTVLLAKKFGAHMSQLLPTVLSVQLLHVPIPMEGLNVQDVAWLLHVHSEEKKERHQEEKKTQRLFISNEHNSYYG